MLICTYGVCCKLCCCVPKCDVGRLRNSKFRPVVFGKSVLRVDTKIGNLEHHFYVTFIFYILFYSSCRFYISFTSIYVYKCQHKILRFLADLHHAAGWLSLL